MRNATAVFDHFHVIQKVTKAIHEVCSRERKKKVIFANYYGRNHLGSIRGVVMLAFALGNAASATGSALIFDITDSYIPVFWAFAGLNVIGMFAAMFARKPASMAIGRV